MFRVIIAGSRNFNNYHLLKTRLNHFLKNKSDIQIVSGTCRGADALGEQYAEEMGYAIKRYPAAWKDLTPITAHIKYNRQGEKYNAKAGYDRNVKMAMNADAGVIFWNGKSPGSKDMIKILKDAKIPYRVVNYDKANIQSNKK